MPAARLDVEQRACLQWGMLSNGTHWGSPSTYYGSRGVSWQGEPLALLALLLSIPQYTAINLRQSGYGKKGRGHAFCQVAFFSASEFKALYSGSVMIARIVWSHVQVASTPALRNKNIKAFSPSSNVAKPLCGMVGSSGRLGRAGSADGVAW